MNGMRVVLAAVAVAMLAPPVSAAPEPAGPAEASVSLRPTWRVGDRWVVETRTRAIQVREEPADEAAAVRWEFVVAGREAFGGREAFRVRVRCLDQGPGPAVTLWVDAATLTLRQVQAQLPTPGGFRTVTETYRADADLPTPVLGPLTALPLDLPAFLPSGAKGLETFQYEALPGPAGTKAVGEVGFLYAVQQTVEPADAAGIKGLLDGPFAADGDRQPARRVRLRGSDRSVEQLWKPALPWPVWSNNGRTTARLVEVGRAESEGPPGE